MLKESLLLVAVLYGRVLLADVTSPMIAPKDWGTGTRDAERIVKLNNKESLLTYSAGEDISQPSDLVIGQLNVGETRPGGHGMAQAIEWLTYQNTEHHFSISYPNSYVIVDERKRTDSDLPSLIFSVDFQDRELADSETAALEVPQASVAVFINRENLSLANWLDLYEIKGERVPVTTSTLTGFRVTLPILIAPNEAFYFASSGLVYRLTLLGNLAKEMLESFRID